MNYDVAKNTADEIVRLLKPHCIECEVAGSVRRKKQALIKDIEVCLIPQPAAMFHLARLINEQWGRPSKGRWPAKATTIRGAFNLDLFTATLETWGMLFFIRTGSAEFVQRALGDWKKLTKGGYSEDCQLHLADGITVPTPTEESVFKAMGKKFVAPEYRL